MKLHIGFKQNVFNNNYYYYNKPDIVAKDYKRKTCLLIDMSIPTENKISVKEYSRLNMKTGK